ncbi:MAG TPA: putative Ig domain-containing protein, partial [Prosthecobacter sp.]|nr:putative Ig domain-containing protein [Prosthecobacter sp.]
TAGNGAGSSLVFRATDANGCQGQRTLLLRACPVISLNPSILPNAMIGTGYSQTVAASGGATPYVFSLSSGTLPNGLALNTSTGVISGTPVNGTAASFTVRVTDPNGCQSERSYALTPTCPSLALNPATLANGTLGAAYSQTLTVTGGTAPFVFAITNGSLPAGLTLNTGTGAITGSPTSTTAASFTVRVTDSYGCQGLKAYTVTPACPVITVTPGSLPLAAVNTAYTQTLTATGGTGPYTWTLTSGTLPAGITLDGTSGVISGTAAASNGAGASLVITVTDSRGCQRQVNANLLVCPVISLSPGTLPNTVSGSVYSQTLSASGGTAPYTYVLASGALPQGLSLDASTGTISGTPNADNSTTFTVRATDAVGCQGSANYSITGGCPTVTISPATLAPARLGAAYAETVTASPGGSNSYSWSLHSGSLPTGLTLNTVDGAITGTPSATGTYSFTLRATHNNGCFALSPYSMTIACPTMEIATTSLPAGYINAAYAQTLSATGNITPVTWTIASGTLPAGLSLSSTGVISGAPATTGTAIFSVRATDEYGCQVTRTLSIGVYGLSIGNLVWVDTNNDAVRQSSESGVPGLRMELWSAGANELIQNGGGDDVKVAADVFTDSSGHYAFRNLAAGSYYVRIPVPPSSYPAASALVDTADNGEDNDSNGLQPSGSGGAVISPLITLNAGTEPGPGVDGDDTDGDASVDFGFADYDSCYTNNLIDNPSFEFQQMPNTTGTLTSVLGYNGSGTSFGAGFNAFQWIGGTNANAALNAPIQRMQVAVGTDGSKVAWMETLKARHGRRVLVLEGSNSTVGIRAAGGANWSAALVPGHEYQLSVWAATASGASSGLTWDLAANSQIFQVLTGATPGLYDHYTVPQGEMVATEPGEQQCCGSGAVGSSLSTFGSADFNNWSESTSNGEQPLWRQFTWRFRVVGTADSAQVDTTTITLSGASGSGPIVVDNLALCRVAPTNTMTLGNQVWNDLNNNGVRDGSELGVGGVAVQLYSSGNDIAGDGDDVLIGTTATSAAGVYNFTSLAAGKYVVKVTPRPSLPVTGGTPVTLDNGVNNDNNGSQPGGPGTALYSPVITLAFGTEPITDGDSNTDTDLSIDFGLFSGLQVGNQIWADTNNDGIFQSASESGISGVTVELLDGATDEVLATTVTNGAGLYSFTTFGAGTYRVRIPTPPA